MSIINKKKTRLVVFLFKAGYVDQLLEPSTEALVTLDCSRARALSRKSSQGPLQWCFPPCSLSWPDSSQTATWVSPTQNSSADKQPEHEPNSQENLIPSNVLRWTNILPGLSIPRCVLRHGMLSVPERPCGPQSWVSHTPTILTSLPAGLPRWRKWKIF